MASKSRLNSGRYAFNARLNLLQIRMHSPIYLAYLMTLFDGSSSPFHVHRSIFRNPVSEENLCIIALSKGSNRFHGSKSFGSVIICRYSSNRVAPNLAIFICWKSRLGWTVYSRSLSKDDFKLQLSGTHLIQLALKSPNSNSLPCALARRGMKTCKPSM